MPEDRVFLDTNILIYAHDISAGKKYEQAQKIIMDLWQSGLGLLSVQVLQEFFVSVTSKIPNPLDTESAKDIVKDLLRWDMVINDKESILSAIDLHRHYKYSFWDSMIIQAAIKGNAAMLLSEDFSHGQTINGLQIKNPFV